MHFQQIVKLNITKDDVEDAIKKVQNQTLLDNLRDRHANVSFDSKLRGVIGEIGLGKWFSENGIVIESKNNIDEASNIDIDFQYKGLDIELKTSLLPDADGDLESAFNKRDIKLIKRGNTIEDLKSDIHIQIFYEHRTKMKDDWLASQDIDLTSDDINYLYEALLGRAYLDKTFLFCWIDKPRLVERLNALPKEKRTWSFGKRDFWICPLKECLPPEELITYLKKYA